VAGVALRIAGFDNVVVYDGSMFEWSRNPQLEVVEGIDYRIVAAASFENDNCD